MAWKHGRRVSIMRLTKDDLHESPHFSIRGIAFASRFSNHGLAECNRFAFRHFSFKGIRRFDQFWLLDYSTDADNLPTDNVVEQV